MGEKRQTKKRTKPQIRDLGKMTLGELSKENLKLVIGGASHSFGTEGDECRRLTVVIDRGFKEDHETVLLKSTGFRLR